MWFFEDSFFSVTLRPSTRWVGVGGQAKWAIGKRGVGKKRDCDVHRCP